MEKTVCRIGVFTSEGGVPSMSVAIQVVVHTSLHMDIECVDIRQGYHGLINGSFTKLTFENVSDLSHRGGTIPYSARNEGFKTPADQEGAVATYKVLGLDTLVSIGDDGALSGLLCLVKRGFSVVGTLDTIDDDIAYSSYTTDYDAVCNTVLEFIDKPRDTIQPHEHCSVVRVMSHRAGYLALTVGVACGVTAVTVPEHPVDYEADLLEPIRRARLADRTHFMIIVVEGVEGGAYFIGKIIGEVTALDTRVTVLGHIQWGGSPSSHDRIIATYIGYEAVRLLVEGKTCRVTAPQGENHVDYDITEISQMIKSLDQHTYEAMRAPTGVH